ncbi:MAG: di-trans,poly-cis-decaprenylcistransferase [Flavobacteriaceae bacterium]|nr:di-trans,poly-cis-decaprenylcistransferase [Flavobacteriaceae bacterium]|tara:strand:- start:6357 stop:7097 length:741 start_codon:yes stop_codon:yes gene_type:complete
MNLEESIKKFPYPKHIAIIMDGNGRWAKNRGKLRIFGHENGTKSVKNIVETCSNLGIHCLTLYAFSTENWNRPKLEVKTLMSLLISSLKKESDKLQKNNIRLNPIGNLNLLPLKVSKELFQVVETTKSNSGMVLNLALSYGSRDEIINCVKEIGEKIKNNLISFEKIDETVINQHLYTQNLPDVDLLIRTSGEQRVSNFLLWQIAYAELYFTEVLWPDFTDKDLYMAIDNYQKRERRFGKTSEQVS